MATYKALRESNRALHLARARAEAHRHGQVTRLDVTEAVRHALDTGVDIPAINAELADFHLLWDMVSAVLVDTADTVGSPE